MLLQKYFVQAVLISVKRSSDNLSTDKKDLTLNLIIFNCQQNLKELVYNPKELVTSTLILNQN